MRISLDRLLAQRASLTPDDEALVSGERRLNWSEADARCTQLATWLAGRGVGPGDRVALLARNSLEAALVLFAASRVGAIAVMLNWRLTGSELTYLLTDSGSRVLVHDAELRELAEAATSDSAAIRVVLGDAPPSGDESSGVSHFARGENEIAVIMYTSGTTGQPKGVVLTHQNFAWAAHGLGCTVNTPEGSRLLLTAPMFHIAGLASLVTSVQRGGTIVFLPNFDPVAIWRTIAAERITTTMLVPTMLAALDKAAAQIPVDTSSIVNLTCGASAVSEELIEPWERRGVPVQQVYGLTEVTGALTLWRPAMGADGRGTQGRPVFLSELRIVDPVSREALPPGEPGEVMARGPTLFAGYWNNAEATRTAFVDGWFATGDIGFLDDRGFLRLVDRLKDIIISGGENIYPTEVETVLAAHPDVVEVAVVGRADSHWGEVPVAYVVVRDGAPRDAAALIEACRSRLAGFKCPRTIIFLETLPRSGVGKVLKRQLGIRGDTPVSVDVAHAS